METEDEVEEKIYLSYLTWAQTQGMSVKLPCDWPSRLAMVPKMNCRRAPGNTCLYALTSGKMGTIQEPINHSKGCGGVDADCTAWIHRRLRFTSFEWCQSGSHNSRSSAWLDSGRHVFGYCFQMYLWRKEAVWKLIIEESLADTKSVWRIRKHGIFLEQLIKKLLH